MDAPALLPIDPNERGDLVTVQVTIPRRHRDLLESLARRWLVTRTTVLRQAIAAYLTAHRGPQGHA